MTLDHIFQRIIDTPEINGITISGGEPILQAAGLSKLLKRVKQFRDLDVISFTGFTLSQLLNRLTHFPEIGEYLDLLDVLIDGLYIKELDDNQGLRGSTNQKIHHLTSRLNWFDFEKSARKVEFFINRDEITMAGIPPHGLLDIFKDVTQNSKLSRAVLDGSMV